VSDNTEPEPHEVSACYDNLRAIALGRDVPSPVLDCSCGFSASADTWEEAGADVITGDGMIVFVRDRLDEVERWALAASSEYSRAAAAPEHWQWVAAEDDPDAGLAADTVLDPEIAIAGHEEFLPVIRASLRSVEHYGDIHEMAPGLSIGSLPHFVLRCEEVQSEVARHVAAHDPARVIREVATWRRILLDYTTAGLDATYAGTERETGFQLALRSAIATKAYEWRGHPGYKPGEWGEAAGLPELDSCPDAEFGQCSVHVSACPGQETHDAHGNPP
jgi:Family of unknown function (DUF6221)